MSAHFVQAKATLDPAARSWRVALELRNDSPKTWRIEEGFATSFQVYDAETGTWILDGPRFHPSHDIAPGESLACEFALELPPERGRYRAFVSAMHEHAGWYWDRGWPFLLLEASIGDHGEVLASRFRVITKRGLAWEDLLRSVGRAISYPFLTIWRNRSLIRAMVRRDVLGRYRGSFGGVFWTLLNPLLLMLTYFFVFAVVLQSRFSSDPSRTGFALYFLAGMLPWLAFSEAAGRAPTVMLEHRNFVRKLVFAVETLPVNLVLSGLFSELIGLMLFTAGLLLARGSVPGSVVWLPVLLAPQILFTAGLSWFLAALGVFVRDLGQIIGFLLTLWFFLTPICYEEAALPAWAGPVLAMNPIFILVRGYRAIFLEGHAPAFDPLWKLTLLSAGIFVAGHAWFYKLRKSFADIL